MQRGQAGRAALLLVAAALLTPGCDAIQSRLIGRQVNAPDRSDWLSDGALHVYLCGTGSPIPSDRAGPCTAVIAGANVRRDTSSFTSSKCPLPVL